MDHSCDCGCKDGTIPLCPDVKFKEIPCYKVTDVLIRPTLLVNESGPNCHIHKALVSFNLTPSQANEIADFLDEEDVQLFPSMKLLLRFCKLDDKKEKHEDMFPPGLEIYLSGGRPVPLKTNPLDILKYVECDAYTPNTLTVVWLGDPGNNSNYCIALYMAKLQLKADQLLHKLKERPTQSADVTRGRIKEIIGVMEEKVGGVTSMTVSVVCPLGEMRMKYPCRTTFCKHVQCFDAQLFFVKNEGYQEYVCPVCAKQFKFDDMVLDDYFIEVMDKLEHEAEDEIELFRDGQWKSKPKMMEYNGVEYVRLEPTRSTPPNPFELHSYKCALQLGPERPGIELLMEPAVELKPSVPQPDVYEAAVETESQVPRCPPTASPFDRQDIPRPSCSPIITDRASRLGNIRSYNLRPRSFYNDSRPNDGNGRPHCEMNGQLENASFDAVNINAGPVGTAEESLSSSMPPQDTYVGSSQLVLSGTGAESLCVSPKKRRKELCGLSGNNESFVPDPVPAETLSIVATLPLSSESSSNGAIDVTPFSGQDNDMSSLPNETTMEPEQANDDEEMSQLAYEVIFGDKVNQKNTFSLKLGWKSSYFDMATKVGKRVGANPKYIQFFKSDPNKDSPGRPMRFSQEDEEFLRKLTGVYTPTRGTYKLFYQVLDVPVEEKMNKKRFKIRFYSPKDRGEREVVVFVNKSSKITANDVLLEISKVVPGDRVMTLRMVKIFQCQISNIVDNNFCADFNYATMSSYHRVEEILSEEENLSENEELVPVAHFNKEIRFTFGVPFLIKVCFGETWLTLKRKIQNRLGVKKREWSKIRIALVSQRSMKYFEKDEDNVPISRDLFTAKARSTNGFKTWIGLDHPFDGPTELIK